MENDKLVVLVVDDSPAIVQRLTNMLGEIEAVGQILQAANYDEALIRLNEYSPSVLLLDISMPGRNGIELLRTIRKQNRMPAVMMISNHTSDHYRQLCHSLGAYYYLDKSNDFYKIPGLIAQIGLN